MRVALYARVSTSDKGQDVQLQLNDLRTWCLKNKHTYTEYIDEGVSGAKKHRPELDRLMHDADRSLFEMVLVWKLDRLGRSLPHLISILEFLRNKKIEFRSHTQEIDTTTPIGKLLFHLLGAFGEYERDLTCERVKAGMAHAKSKGKKLGRPGRKLDIKQLRKLKATMSYDQVSRETGLPKSDVYRALKAKEAR